MAPFASVLVALTCALYVSASTITKTVTTTYTPSVVKTTTVTSTATNTVTVNGKNTTTIAAGAGFTPVLSEQAYVIASSAANKRAAAATSTAATTTVTKTVTASKTTTKIRTKTATKTATTTQTVQPTAYAACQRNNLVDFTPSRQTIDFVAATRSSMDIESYGTAVECCIACQKFADPNFPMCVASAWDSSNGDCYLFYPAHYECIGTQANVLFNHVGKGTSKFTVSNTQCGQCDYDSSAGTDRSS